MVNRPYRYRLHRIWGPHGFDSRNLLAVIGLNPSTATDTKDDPTIRRCIDFAQRWGHDGLIMLNAFAYRSTDPKGLLGAKDPIGPDNDAHLRANAKCAGRVLLAWGSKASPRHLHELVQTRGAAVRAMVVPLAQEVCAIGWNADGSPEHPLFKAKDAALLRVEI